MSDSRMKRQSGNRFFQGNGTGCDKLRMYNHAAALRQRGVDFRNVQLPTS
jgi:hypothetical protein